MRKELLVKMFKDYLKGNNAGEVEGVCYMDDNTAVYFHQDFKEFKVSCNDIRELPDIDKKGEN